MALAGVGILISGNRFNRRRFAGASDHPVFTAGVFLFCKRVRPISQVVYGDEALSESSGEFCEEQGDDLENEALHSSTGFFYADYGISDDEESSGKDFYCVFNDFQVCLFFYTD